jgi:hypothetical protein
MWLICAEFLVVGEPPVAVITARISTADWSLMTEPSKVATRV